LGQTSTFGGDTLQNWETTKGRSITEEKTAFHTKKGRLPILLAMRGRKSWGKNPFQKRDKNNKKERKKKKDTGEYSKGLFPKGVGERGKDRTEKIAKDQAIHPSR